MQKAGSRLTPTSRLLSARYFSLSTDWAPQGWRLKLEMFMGGCRSFWGTCWNQMKLPASAKPLCPRAWGCHTRCLSALGWVAGKGPTVMTISFEESCAGGTMHCPFLAWMPSCHFFSVSFPLPPVKSYPWVLAETLQQSGMFILAVPRRICTEPASCLPTCFSFNQVMTNWLIQNLSRTKWWGRRLWRAAIIPQLSVVRPENNYSFCNQASLPCF